MKMLARGIALIGVLAVSAAGAGLVLAAPGGGGSGGGAEGSGKGFKPKQLAGKWTGNWKNSTFGSKGAVRGTVKAKGKKFDVLWDIDGFVFGCPDPPSERTVLKKGNGNNKWNSKSFKAVDTSETYGKLTFNYKHAKNKVSGRGVVKKPAPSGCNTGISYKFKGKLTKKKLEIDTEIFGNGTKFADSNLTANKK